MIPYTIIKEVNADELKGVAAGVINFLVFTLSAIMEPVCGWVLLPVYNGGPLGWRGRTPGAAGAARMARAIDPAFAGGRTHRMTFACDMAPLVNLTARRGLGPVRSHRPVSVGLLPPCNPACPAGENIQAWLAHALVLFNRFDQPDLDIVSLKVLNELVLSEQAEIRLPLLWLAVLRGRLTTSLAASTGVATSGQAVNYLLASAGVVMDSSALLRRGPAYDGGLLSGLHDWLQARDFASLEAVRGLMSQQKLADPQAFERARYLKILHFYGPR